MSPVRIYGDQGYSELKAPTQAVNTSFTLPSGTGNNGDFLRSDGTGNFSYGTPSPSGALIQSRIFLSSGTFSSASTTYVPVVSGVITPYRANSKMLIMGCYAQCDASNADTFSAFRITNGSTLVIDGGTSIHNNNAADYKQATQVSINYLHSPSYTLGNPLQYVMEFNNNIPAGTCYVRNGTNSLIILEVAQ